MTDKKTTVSIANTPVQRALARARRSTLLILFAVGIIGGLVYKMYVKDEPVPTPPATTSQQQR